MLHVGRPGQDLPGARWGRCVRWTWDIRPSPGHDSLGHSLIGGADFNGDGFEDLGASQWTGTGRNVSLIYGGAAGPSGPVPGTLAPSNSVAMEAVPDIDGDGTDEIVAGWGLARVGGVRKGGAGILRQGTVTPGPADVTLGSAANDGVGTGVTSGDYNGNGLRDWAAGAPGIGYGPGEEGIRYDAL